MLDTKIEDRTKRLLIVSFQERDKQLPLDVRQIEHQASATGTFRSGNTIRQIHGLYEREIEIRAVLIWENLIRVHKTLGSHLSDTLADDLKESFVSYLTECDARLSPSLAAVMQKLNPPSSVDLSLNNAISHARQKHEIEADIYADSLKQQEISTSGAKSSEYNFYGNVGTVQTGPNASANVIQNLGAEDKEALLSALHLVSDSIATMHELAEIQKAELTEIVCESVSELESAKPNNTKMRMLLATIASTIQTVASAPHAYQTLKVALMPLGIMLP